MCLGTREKKVLTRVRDRNTLDLTGFHHERLIVSVMHLLVRRPCSGPAAANNKQKPRTPSTLGCEKGTPLLLTLLIDGQQTFI